MAVQDQSARGVDDSGLASQLVPDGIVGNPEVIQKRASGKAVGSGEASAAAQRLAGKRSNKESAVRPVPP